MKKSLVNKILQIGIVVKDVEKSVQTWEEVYGIGPWQVFGEEASGAVTEMKVWGEYKNYSAKVAMCNVADVEITHEYGAEEAIEVINRSLEDYRKKFEPLNDAVSSV